MALQAAQKIGLQLTSGHRSDEHSAAVGGHAGDPHTKGQAYDFSTSTDAAGMKKMDEFAAWAAQSGMFSQVIWRNKDLLSGKTISGHMNHVHVGWGGQLKVRGR